jgi:hypothetical protein
MNDAHFMARPEQHSMTSEFWFKHRHEFTIKESPLPFQPAYGNLLDYSHAAVRQLRLDTVVEVLERNRDLVDGFELDFNRFQVFFPKGRAAAGAPLITEIVRQVRARLDELAREQRRPMHLFVRVPPSLADCATAGLEVERWIREGLVDLVSPAQIMTLAGDMPISDLVKLAQKYGVRLHPSLYPRTSWRVPFPPGGVERYASAAVTRDASLAEIRGAAAAYRALGVDGFYLFNFYNAFGSERPYDGRLLQVFRDLAREENLLGQSSIYAVTKSYYNDGPGSYAYGKQLPAKLVAGAALHVMLAIAERPASAAYPLQACELRVGFRALPAEARVAIALNGAELFRGRLADGAHVGTCQITGARSKQPDLAEDYLHVPLSVPGPLKRGENAFTVTLADGAGKSAEVTDLEVRFDYENDYEQLWLRTPVELNRPAKVGAPGEREK